MLAERIADSLICCLLLTLCACGNETPKPVDPNRLSAGTQSIIYGETVYYYDFSTSSIKYQKIDDVSDTGIPLINDPLLEDDLNPFINMSGLVLMLIDYEATLRNDDFPVFLITYEDYSNVKEPHYSIVSFNIRNNEIKVIKDDIYDNIQTLHLYNNSIYYTLNRGNEGYDMCRVDIDGKNFAQKDNPDLLCYRIHSIYNDKIYYTSDGLNKLYSCNLDFSDDCYLADTVLKADFFVYDDYLYYYSNPVGSELGAFPVFSADLMRMHISDPSSSELVLSGLSVGMNHNSKYYYYKSSPRLFGDSLYDDGTNVLYVLDLASGEDSVFYDYGDNTSITYYDALSDSWILFEGTDFGPVIRDPAAKPTSERYVINTETKEKIVLPR